MTADRALVTGTPAPWLDAFLAERGAQLVALRRHIHAHPELSGQEEETTALVVATLRDVGLAPRVLDSGTGVLCDVGPGGGPTVALRADIDALAMNDEKDVAYRSTVSGVAHACGHDVHTTMVLGAGLALAGRVPRGTVRLIFEPAEETVPGGALDVIRSGGLDGVDAMFGLHCDPKLDAGWFGTRVGEITSATDQLAVELHGPGGHTARPHLTVDLVALAGRVASELPAIVRARAHEHHGADVLVVFGSIRAGDAANVIPVYARLTGSVRTPDRKLWEGVESLVRSALEEIVGPTGAGCGLDYRRGIPPVVNDAAATAILAEAAADALGPAALVESPQSYGGDSFAWYLEEVPGSFGRIGVHDPHQPERLDLHAGRFDVDERAIEHGVRVLVHTALRALEAG